MNKKDLQENEYEFPYHYIPQFGHTGFSQARLLGWGYVYASYLEAIIDAIDGYAGTIKSLVDIGCGDGRLATEISKRFPSLRVAGTDYSEKSLRFARAFSPHISFSQTTEETFDCFALIEVIEHIPPAELPAFIAEVRGKLNPNGVGVITVPSSNIPTDKKHYQHFSEQSLRRYVDLHFTIESVRYLNKPEPKWLRRLFSNTVFILNYPPLLNYLYRLYKRQYLYTDAGHGARILMMVRARDNVA